jgi:hypothetical protein
VGVVRGEEAWASDAAFADIYVAESWLTSLAQSIRSRPAYRSPIRPMPNALRLSRHVGPASVAEFEEVAPAALVARRRIEHSSGHLGK